MKKSGASSPDHHGSGPGLEPDNSTADAELLKTGIGRRWFGPRSMPYLLIALVCTFCHGFILTNDGPIWDGWYWANWLTNRNWPAMVEYTSAQGLPYTLWAFAPFAYVPNMIPAGMWASFLCLIIEGILVFELALRLAPLTRAEALSLSLLALALPLFSAAQDFPVFGLIVFRMLFLVAALLATLATETRGSRHWVLRVLALAGFYFSCTTNGALIVYYGGFYLLLLLRDWRDGQGTFKSARGFIFRYPDFFLLPPAVYAARLLFIPQFGWYENYNKVSADLGQFGANLWSFFENVVYFHAEKSVLWPFEHPVVTLMLFAAAGLCVRFLPSKTWGRRSGIASIHFAWFGALFLSLAVFPLAIAGKYFAPNPTGELSRHCMLTSIPLAILLFGLIRSVLFVGRNTSSRWMFPIVGCAVVVFGSQVLPVYLSERAEWIFNRSLLHNARRNPVVRESSVIFWRPFSTVFEDIYGIYGVASEFGGLTRFVTSRVPSNQNFFLPMEIDRYLLSTSIIPNEYRLVNPSGQQVLLKAERKGEQAGAWQLAWHYLSLRWFGTTTELDTFLTSLCTVEATVLKPASPFALGPPAQPPEPPPASGPKGDFTNGAGIRFVFLPWGWWAAKFETTQAQYGRVMGANPSMFKDPSRPVECVSWNDATEFCRRLTQSERDAGRLPAGLVYRLPTAEEFERLLAEGTLANTVTSTQEIQWHTQPVGTRPPNSLGLHDVVGNVWEWCEDWWDQSHRLKVSKGASWVNVPGELTSYRGAGPPTDWLVAGTIERLQGPIRKDYPDQAFWDRGFRVVIAKPVPDPMPALSAAAK